jgi:hypothetical protein
MIYFSPDDDSNRDGLDVEINSGCKYIENRAFPQYSFLGDKIAGFEPPERTSRSAAGGTPQPAGP